MTDAPVTLVPRPMPPAGIYVQVYRGAYHGTPQQKRDALRRHCDELAAEHLPGVVMHGFPQELHDAWDGLAQIAHDRGLLACASWGLDSKDITATRKGELVGDVLATDSCAAGLADAEGQHDTTVGPNDDMNEAGDLVFGRTLRAKAPTAWFGDQCWPMARSHSHVRPVALPIGQGGPLDGFPVDEFATFINWRRYRQFYCNDWKRQWGRERYPKVRAWMDRDWNAIAPALAAAGLTRDLGVTLQGYGWDDIPSSLTHALLTESCGGRPVIVWSEPFPDVLVMDAIRFVHWCEHEGFAAVGVDPVVAGRLAQEALVRAGAVIDVDGACGAKTIAAWKAHA